jgi:hypothetical protein
MPRDYRVNRTRILEAMPGSRVELAKATGIEDSTVVRWLRVLRAERGCHIRRWERCVGRGSLIPVYASGPGEDAPNPGPEGQAVYSKRYRESIRGTERWDRVLASKRANWHADQAAAGARRDPIMEGLFGRRPTATGEPHDGEFASHER